MLSPICLNFDLSILVDSQAWWLFRVNTAAAAASFMRTPKRGKRSDSFKRTRDSPFIMLFGIVVSML